MRIKNSKLTLYIFSIYLFVFISCESEAGIRPPQEENMSLEDYESSYNIIQGEIFDKYCISCHIAGNPYAAESGLILTADISYASLINKIPNNEYAAGDELFRVSTAGGIQGTNKSFLIEKINARNMEHFNTHAGYGSIMPIGPLYLTNGQIDFIWDWISEGAPETGQVADISFLDNIERYDPEFIPLKTPENGIQIHLGPFEVAPQQETEFFYFTDLDNENDEFINRVEIEMRTGSHHFILYTYPEIISDEINFEEGVQRHLRNEDGSYIESVLEIMPYQIFLTGTQWPELDVYFPDNVGLRLPANTYVDQNIHYLNYTNESIIGEVYTNLHFMDSEPGYIAEILQLSVIEELFLPPKDTTTIEKAFMFEDILDVYNLDAQNINSIDIFQLFSHAHEKMLIFEVFFIDNNSETDDTLRYYCDDWEHPPIKYYGEPYNNEGIQILPNEGLRLKATYYNWTDEAIDFGFLSTDEMMILFGYFYTQ